MGLCFGTLLLLLLVYTLFLYFEFTTKEFYIIFIMIFSIFIGSYYLGSFANSKGYLEGLKFASTYSLISLIISLYTRPPLTIGVIVYYLIIYLSSIVGSILGINIKKTDN